LTLLKIATANSSKTHTSLPVNYHSTAFYSLATTTVTNKTPVDLPALHLDSLA